MNIQAFWLHDNEYFEVGKSWSSIEWSGKNEEWMKLTSPRGIVRVNPKYVSVIELLPDEAKET